MRALLVLFLAAAALGDYDMTFEGCAKRELKCKDGTCLKYNKFCDGAEDCEDKSDEFECDQSNPSRALNCEPEACKLPHCFCSYDGRQIPGGLTLKQTPQMVMLTFDDAVHDGIDDELMRILDEKMVNPNGCSMKGTFFVSHDFTDYTLVHRLHRMGHEIAVHSLTHEYSRDYWQDLDVDSWTNEMIGQKYVLSKLANISIDDIQGMRAPVLAHGGNNMFEMMSKEGGFTYDSSVTAGYDGHPVWPYTLDYGMSHNCFSKDHRCPTRSFPGVWEIPINQIDPSNSAKSVVDEDTGKSVLEFPHVVYPGCGMVDSCHAALEKAPKFRHMLLQAFFRNYNTNRAPLGIFVHAATFKGQPELMKPFKNFIRTIAEFEDVYFVRMSDVIAWMKNPVPVDQLAAFEPWKTKCRTEDYFDIKRSVQDRCRLRQCTFRGVSGHIDACNVCPRVVPTLKTWQNI